MSTSAQVLERIDSVRMPSIMGRGAYVAYLKFAHGIMRASGPLLALGYDKAEGALREYYGGHLIEERDHADWLAEDLASLGEQPELVDHAAAAIAGAQYYYLHHVGPEPLLGYIAAMEMRPATMNDVRALEETHGKRAVRTIRHHAEADIRHGDRLAEVLNEQNEYRELILYNAVVSAQAFSYYCAERTWP